MNSREENKESLKQFLKYYKTALFLAKLQDRVHLFVDSKDVIKILLGIGAYEKELVNDKFPTFNKEDLVYANLFNGYFGPFYLLVPHQRELIYNIEIWEKDQKTFNSSHTVNSIRTKLDKLRKQVSGKSSVEDIKSIVKNLYELDYFSVLGWKKRLSKIYSEEVKTLCLDQEEYDYVALFDGDLFRDIRIGLENNREMSRNINNADALALTILAQKLKKFKRNPRTNTFPIFYDRSNYFKKIIRQIGLKEYFTYNSSDGKDNFWILQSYPYFEVHNLIRSWYKKDNLLFEELALLKTEISQKERSGIYILEDTIKSLNESLTKLQNTHLVKLFWEQQESSNVNDFFQYIEEKIDSDVSKVLNKSYELIIRDIRKYTEHYNIATRSFNSIEPSLIKLLKEEQLRNNLEEYRQEIIHFAPCLVFSLVKFSINEHIKEGVVNLLKEIFISSKIDFSSIEENRKSSAYHKLIKLNDGIYSRIIYPLRNGVANYEDQNKLEEVRQQLGQGLAVLWVLDKYDLIVTIFDYLKEEYFYYSNILIYLAALVKQINSHKNFKEKENRIKDLLGIIEKYKSQNGNQKYGGPNSYKIDLGVSYIYGELWQRLNPSSIKFNLNNINPQPSKSRHNTRIFLYDTIKLLKTAKNWLEENHRYLDDNFRQKCYYTILNNFIYYTTIGLPEKDFNSINKKDVSNLAQILTNPEFCQPTFYDTLALVNLRKAAINKKRRDKIGFDRAIMEAKIRIQEAINHALKYDDYKKFVELKKQIHFCAFDDSVKD